MLTSDATARLAGFLYLATAPTTGFAYGYVEFMPHGDPAATLGWFVANRQVLAWTVLAGATGFVVYLALGLLLRQLLAPAGKLLADLMLLLVAASVPLALAATADRLDLLALIDTITPAALPQALLYVQREHNIFQVCAIFWGLWMLPLGWLTWRSGLAPRVIAGLLIFGGIGYLTGFVGPVLDPHYTSSTLGRVAGYVFIAPDLLGELGFGLWLLVFGARGLKASREND